ncbi:MAG: L-lactate permease [Clostridiales bacterium]|nr:L-lactate permease [Clostridiales bacterium]
MSLAFLALLPVAFVMLALARLKMPAHLAGVCMLALSAVLALSAWKANGASVLEAGAEGLFLAFCPVIWVIFCALLTYNMTVETGAMDVIVALLKSVSGDRRILALAISFCFGGFLEAAAGFGTAVAIPAGILAAIGFPPMSAAIICLAANTVPVAFGVMGIPIMTLASVTGLDLGLTSLYAAIQLLPLAIALPVFIVFLASGGVKEAKGAVIPAIASGAAFGVVQVAVAVLAGPELAASAGSIAAFLALIATAKLVGAKPGEPAKGVNAAKALKAASPYIIVMALALAASFWLKFLKSDPFLLRFRFYSGEGGTEQTFAYLSNPGTIFLVAGIAGSLIYGAKPQDMAQALAKTAKQVSRSAIAVATLMMSARIMAHSGMISSLANLMSGAGMAFPILSPVVGALGTFVTGSDTSSNVLFGPLQKETAIQAGLNVSWIAAANASGATIGKMISPQSIAIASSSINIKGGQGELLKKGIKYAAVMALALAGIVLAGSLLLG